MKTWILSLVTVFSALQAAQIPDEMQKIMHQKKYAHATWGVYAKDLETGEVLYDLNSDKLFSPASTSKLFSVAALLDALGDDYRFKTPLYATGNVEKGQLNGDLVLVGQGDLTFGGRQPSANTISFTKMDHIIANEVPGAILTKEDPLKAILSLAEQVYLKGIHEVKGDVVIDDSLFETTEKRGMQITPIMINENLIDLTLNPTTVGQPATLTWRPQVPGYSVENQVKTVAKSEKLALEVSSDETGQRIVVKGSIPTDQRNVVRTSPIKNPKAFARAALLQALEKNGIKVSGTTKQILPSYKGLQPIAEWNSPPLSEYAKLILKVSHNLGADLVPLLLATHAGQKNFNDGMLLIGKFVTQKVNLSPNDFVFIDAAGGNENRLTPQAEVQLLTYMQKQSPSYFKKYFDALPVLGVDGSLEDFGKKTEAVGKVHSKSGTSVAYNLATQKFFLITQALSGYVQGKNGHLYAYMVVVNNAAMPTIDDIFAIFEDESQLSSMIYNHTE